jgi:hypothetical protein
MLRHFVASSHGGVGGHAAFSNTSDPFTIGPRWYVGVAILNKCGRRWKPNVLLFASFPFLSFFFPLSSPYSFSFSTPLRFKHKVEARTLHTDSLQTLLLPYYNISYVETNLVTFNLIIFHISHQLMCSI